MIATQNRSAWVGAMTLVTHLPVAAAARLMGEHDTRLWRIVTHYVEAALARLDLADLRRFSLRSQAFPNRS